MIATLEERKNNLLNQIEELKREIDILKWPEYEELAFLRCTCSVRYLGLYRLQESSKN